MSLQAIDLQQLTIAGIAHRCAEETERFFQHQFNDPRFCFELLRRAIVDHDESAWKFAYDQYFPLVTGWVKQHSAFTDCGEEIHYFVNRSFEKMWLALTPDRFQEFPNLESILRYLQMCVHSTILDWVRRKEHHIAESSYELPLHGGSSGASGVEKQALAKLQGEEIWRLVNARLRNKKERLVIYGSYALALKPRDLYRLYQDDFNDVTEIYRIKENVLARLRRDSDLGKLLKRYA